MPTPGKGRLIIFEGMDGVGKTTQIKAIFERLGGKDAKNAKELMYVEEPGGTPMGRHLRKILLDDAVKLNPEEMLMMFTLQRHFLLRQVVEPAIKAGMTVLSDRSLVSTFVYQTQAGLSVDRVKTASWPVLEILNFIPKQLFILDVPPEIARERSLTEGGGTARMSNHFDHVDIAMYADRRNRYLQVPMLLSWPAHIIDGTKDPNEITDEIVELIKAKE